MKRYFTTAKNGDSVEVDQDLARQLVASGKKRPEDFEIQEDSTAAPSTVVASPAPSTVPSAMETTQPSYAAAQGQGWGPEAWATAKDALTMPFRAAAGAGGALGTLAGGGSLSDAGVAFRQDMAHPGQSVADLTQSGDVPAWQRRFASPAMYAGMAENPTTLPSIAVGGAPISGLGQGLAMGLMSYGTRQGDAMANGQPVNPLPSGWDLLPAALGAGGDALVTAPQIGNNLMEGAKALIRSQIKTSAKKGGIVGQGLQQGLDAGYLPMIAGRGTISVPQMEKNFDKVFIPTQQEFTPTLRALEDAGVKISTNQAVDAAQGHLANYIAGGGVIPAETQGRSAIDWFRQRVAQPDNPQDVVKILSGYTEPKMRGPIIAIPQTTELTSGFTASAPTVNESAYAMEIGKNGPQMAYDANLMPIRIPTDNPQVQIPSKNVIYGVRYKELMPAPVQSAGDILVSPSTAHFRKSGILKEAFKNPETATANGEVAMGGGMNLRQQIINGGVNPSPEAIQAGQQYQDLLQRSAPLYAMEAAMRQAGQRANRYPLSLYSALRAPIQMVQEFPATARWMYDAGSLGQRLLPVSSAIAPYASALPVAGALPEMGSRQ